MPSRLWRCFRNISLKEAEHLQGADYEAATPSISSDSDVGKLQRTTNDDEPMKYGDAGGDGLTTDQWKCAAGESAYWYAWEQFAWSNNQSIWRTDEEHERRSAAPPPPRPIEVDDEGNELLDAPPSSSTSPTWRDFQESQESKRGVWDAHDSRHLSSQAALALKMGRLPLPIWTKGRAPEE